MRERTPPPEVRLARGSISDVRKIFPLLIVVQAAHSIEECVNRLFDVFLPARFIGGLVSSNIAAGFALANIALVAWGAWCFVARIRPWRHSALMWAWFWALLEIGNGLSHTVFAIARGGYFPGLWTAPFLLGMGGWLVKTLAGLDNQAATE